MKGALRRVYPAFLLALALYALLQLMRGNGPASSWVGLGLSALAPLFFLFIHRGPRVDGEARHPVGYSAACGLGVAICMAVSWRHGPVAGIAHAWAGLSLVAWLAYLRWLRPGTGRA